MNCCCTPTRATRKERQQQSRRRRRRRSVLRSLAQLSRDSDFLSVHYSASILALASFLADDQISYKSKLECIRALVSLRTRSCNCSVDYHEVSVESSSLAEDILIFVTERDSPRSECPIQSEEVLLWELRAIYQYIVEKQHVQRQEEIRERFQQGSDRTASIISKGAEIVESTLTETTKIVTTEIDGLGGLIKAQLEPCSQPEPLFSDHPKIEATALEYTGSVRHVTDSARVAAKQTMMKLREVSVQGITAASGKIEQDDLAAKIIPDPNGRMILSAAGQIGMTSLGAAAIVGEAMFNTTSSIIKKTADVTADVTEHKYGHIRGQLVRDTSNTVGNVFRTVTTVGMMFKSKALTTAVVKDAGKKHTEKRMAMV